MNPTWGIVNARIITMDPKMPEASGLAVRGRRILFVGTTARVKRELGRGSRLVDLGRRTVIPGFIDSHTHLIGTGIERRLRLDLSRCVSKRDVLACLRSGLRGRRRGEVVIGVDWDQSRWTDRGPRPQTAFERAELDRISPANPVVLRRICGHVAFANRLALARIGRGWQEVDRESGLLLEDVVAKINRIFPPQADEMIEAIDHAIGLAHRLGITSAHEIVDRFYFEHLSRYLRKPSHRRLRFYLSFDVEDLDYLLRRRVRTGTGDDFTRFGGVKLYADGSIGARTAALHQGYRGDRKNRGRLLLTLRQLTGIIRQAEDQGFQVLIHTIGDRALSQVLSGFQRAGIKTNRLRHRLEHVEILTRSRDLEMLERSGLLVSLQPNFIGNWGQARGMYETYLGRARWRRINRLESMHRAGLKMLFGSDCMPPDPLYGLYWAVHHPVHNERLKISTALQCYTKNGAFGSFEEGEKGSLEPGKSADFVVLDRALDSPGAISKARVRLTVLDGRPVFEG